MTREELGVGYYKLNVPKTGEYRRRNDRIAGVFKRAFELSTEELLKSIPIVKSKEIETTQTQSTEY
jgi:hypothetical protein